MPSKPTEGGLMVSAPVSLGELVDKITILEIKAAHITAPAALANVQRERDALGRVLEATGIAPAALAPHRAALKQVNEALWRIEDDLRLKEARQEFDAAFVELARSVYKTNDERARLKREINTGFGSALVEEKHYPGLS